MAELPVISPSVTPSKFKRIDVAKAFKLRLQGNTFAEIAAVFGVTDSAVHKALQSFEAYLKDVQPGELTTYSEERRNILTLAEGRLLRSVVDEDAIQKAPLAARTMAFGVIFDKRRLEEGKSTENIGVLGKLILGSEDQLGTTSGREKRKKKPVD